MLLLEVLSFFCMLQLQPLLLLVSIHYNFVRFTFFTTLIIALSTLAGPIFIFYRSLPNPILISKPVLEHVYQNCARPLPRSCC
jgi:hypothetical protein